MGRLAERLNETIARGRSADAGLVHWPSRAPAHGLRIPRVYLRNERETPTLGAFAKRVLAGLRREQQPFARISRAWAQAAPDVASHTEVVGFADGRLEVAVDSAPLRSELQSFRAHTLLLALQQGQAGVTQQPLGCDVAELHFTLRRRAPARRRAPSRTAGREEARHAR